MGELSERITFGRSVPSSEELSVTRSLSRSQAILLGILVLGGLVLGGLGLFWIGGRNTAGVPPFLARWLLPDSLHLRAGFARIQGVEVGTRVRVRGIDAGEVIAIEQPTTPKGDITLVLRLKGSLRNFVREDATAQIMAEGMVGGKVIEIEPGSDDQSPVADNATIKTKPSSDVSDLLAKVEDTLGEIRNGRGSLYKLVHDDELHAEAVNMLKQGKRALNSLQENSDAFKEMPVVRGYVRDMRKLLVRPDCERNRRVFAESELFEPGGAILTAGGKQRLDEIVKWLEGLKHTGSEVVVPAYTVADGDPDNARTLTQKQAQAVCSYLTDKHSVQKMGWFSFSRKVTPLGCGAEPPPIPEKESLPARRVEVIVFVPHG
jgi:phospholipid/cholesterol/gamma-HCH transport system substrate-binding protein